MSNDGPTTFAPHRDTVEAFVASMHGGAGTEALLVILADDAVLYGPLSDDPVTGRESVLKGIQQVGAVATDLTYTEVLSGLSHHAAHFRLHVDDSVVDGMDHMLLGADGRITEVTLWWRPLPMGVQMQRTPASHLGMTPWELVSHAR